MSTKLRLLLCPEVSYTSPRFADELVARHPDAKLLSLSGVYGVHGKHLGPIDQLNEVNDRRLQALDEQVDAMVCDLKTEAHPCIDLDTCHNPMPVICSKVLLESELDAILDSVQCTEKPTACVSCKRRYANWAEANGIDKDVKPAKRLRRTLRSNVAITRTVRFLEDIGMFI